MFLDQCVVSHSVRAFHMRIYTLHVASILFVFCVLCHKLEAHLFSWCKQCLYMCVWNKMSNFRNETNSP